MESNLQNLESHEYERINDDTLVRMITLLRMCVTKAIINNLLEVDYLICGLLNTMMGIIKRLI